MPVDDVGFLGTFAGGRIKIARDPVRFTVLVFDERGGRIGEIDESQWYSMSDDARNVWLHELLLEREANVRELKRPNTQGVINYLAKIGKEWADGQQAAVLRGAH